MCAAARRPQANMYDLAMTIYFGMYGATMTTNSELFWGPNSIMMLPYMSSVGDAQSAFFQRMTGLGFAIMSLGYAKCGVSKDAWIKQTMLFHVVSTPIFFLQCASDDGTSFTPWVWYRALRRRGGCLHFLRHRRDAIDATRHYGSVRSPNRHQRRAGWLGLHRDVKEQDEVDVSTVRRGTLWSLTPRRPHPFDS